MTGTWFGAHLSASATKAGSRTALVFRERSWTYAELDRAVRRTAARLEKAGRKPGT